jgi:hypothetical protein
MSINAISGKRELGPGSINSPYIRLLPPWLNLRAIDYHSSIFSIAQFGKLHNCHYCLIRCYKDKMAWLFGNGS